MGVSCVGVHTGAQSKQHHQRLEERKRKGRMNTKNIQRPKDMKRKEKKENCSLWKGVATSSSKTASTGTIGVSGFNQGKLRGLQVLGAGLCKSFKNCQRSQWFQTTLGYKSRVANHEVNFRCRLSSPQENQ